HLGAGLTAERGNIAESHCDGLCTSHRMSRYAWLEVGVAFQAGRARVGRSARCVAGDTNVGNGLAGSYAPQHAVAVCLRAARHVRVEGDRVVLVRHAGRDAVQSHAIWSETN